MPCYARCVAISFDSRRYSKAFLLAVAATVAGIVLPRPAGASVTYGYDQLGRVNTALYDNGVCVVYAYDKNGNRTSQTNTSGGAPETAIWGTGSWGCFSWTP